jgi:phosphate transport system substrate-binding protein
MTRESCLVVFVRFVRTSPKTTKIGTDAIAFFSNKNNNDTLVALKDVILFMQGKKQRLLKVWCSIIQILVPRVI